MQTQRYKTAFTLVEMIVAVSIVVVLVAIVIGVASRIDNQAKERLTRGTIAIINSALEEFSDYRYQYTASYVPFKFPLDCNGFAQTMLEAELGVAVFNVNSVQISDGIHTHTDPNYSGCEAMYFFLSQVPDSRKILERIDKSLITNKGVNNQPMEISILFTNGDKKVYSLMRILDPWGQVLRYDYYDETASLAGKIDTRRTFPVITSAGPDRKFDTPDDITSR